MSDLASQVSSLGRSRTTQEKEIQKKIDKNKELDEQIAMAWEILSPEGKNVVTKSQLFETMKALFPQTSAKDIRDLVGPGNMTLQKLQVLLTDVDTQNVDVDAEAFKHLDSQGTGLVDMSVLYKTLLQVPGVEMLDEADKALIESLVDQDKDGKISLADFKQIGSWEPHHEAPTDHLKKLMKDREAREKRDKIRKEELDREKERLAAKKDAK